MRLRRSMVWVNTGNIDKLEEVIASNTDCIQFDLEDGVFPGDKPAARKNVLEALKKYNFRGKERIVRVNGMDTPYFWDDFCEVILPGAPDAIRMPKCEDVKTILKMDALLSYVEAVHKLEPDTIKIILTLETTLGIMRCYEMATCCSRVAAVGPGMEDLTASIGVQRNYEIGSPDLLYARQKMVLEAKAAGIMPLDSGVLFNGDPDYMYQESLNCKRHGFMGRSVGDLSLVDTVNKAFSPSEEEADWARRVIDGYEEAARKGEKTLYIDGKFIDPPVVLKAIRINDMVKLIHDMKNQ